MSVYTAVSEPELRDFLCQYNIGELVSHVGISAGIENTNYFVDTTQGRYILTLFEHHTAEELVYFLDLMAVLSDASVPTAKPIKRKQGDIISTLNGKPASIVTCLQGETLDKQETSVAQCESIGDALAKMHLAGSDFPHQREPDKGASWRRMIADKLVDNDVLNLDDQQLLRQELECENSIDLGKLPSGVIHADLFRDNAMFDGDTLTGIIDLYYACNDSFLYDMAVVVNDWCCRPEGGLDEEKLSPFLNAYHKVRPLEQGERDAWFVILKSAALRFWLSRLHDKLMPREGELIQVKDPDEFKAKLHALIDSQAMIESCWVDQFDEEKA